MSTPSRCLASAAIAAALFSGPLHAETCQPEQSWKHEHSSAEANTETTDIKGTRATRIEVCRAEDETDSGLKVEVQFAGNHTSRPLPTGTCLDKVSKWAVIKSQGKQASDGVPVLVQGMYKICRE